MTERPDLLCTGCGQTPEQLSEYVEAAEIESIDEAREITASDYCWREEGTLNRENGHFLCTSCYIKAGMPSSPSGWRTP